ncbi:MAG TPA: rod shape-determining protein MreC [Opitutaceae bacterium]|nr:rod shape-determining protein MreC [Opitutaceae bacterium]
MSFKRFDQAKPFVTLGIIVLAWLLLPVAVKSFLRVTFSELQAPIEVTASYVRDLQEFWADRAHSKNELIEAARDLRHVYAGYEFQAQQTEAQQAEIARLEQLVRLPSNPNFRLEPARVCRRDLSGWWQQLTIRKGSNYDLPVGAPVVYSGGVVGRVREVRAYEADVDLVSSPRMRLAANFEDDTRPVSYQGGNNPPLAPARGLVEFVPPDIVIYSSAPRRLVTSGLGEFPPGVTIGYVTRLETSADGLFQSGEVSLDPRLSELTEVTVLVPLQPN